MFFVGCSVLFSFLFFRFEFAPTIQELLPWKAPFASCSPPFPSLLLPLFSPQKPPGSLAILAIQHKGDGGVFPFLKFISGHSQSVNLSLLQNSFLHVESSVKPVTQLSPSDHCIMVKHPFRPFHQIFFPVRFFFGGDPVRVRFNAKDPLD